MNKSCLGGNRLKKYWRKMTKPRSEISKDGFIRYYARKSDCSDSATNFNCSFVSYDRSQASA